MREEWNERFAPSPQDEQAVTNWATSQGLTITQRYANRLLVDVEAPTAIIERALGVSINRYQLGENIVFSNDRDPSIPASLVGIVHSVLGLNNIEVFHSFGSLKGTPPPDYSPGPAYALGKHLQGNNEGNKPAHAGTDKTGNSSQHSQGSGSPEPYNYYSFLPSDISSSAAYDYAALRPLGHCCNPLNNPGNSPPEASIAIAIWDDFSDSDLAGFVSSFYLAYNVQRYSVDGTPQCCSPEPTLDVEWSTATANSFNYSANTAEVHIYEGANNHFSTLMDVLNQALSDGHARVLNMSWGTSEAKTSPNNMDTAHAIFNQMAGQGWSLVAASGDNGATTDCADYLQVSYPASDPDVTAVGGTNLTTNYGSSTEVAWSGGPQGCASNDGGSGGGCSTYFGNPAYQPPYCGNYRSVPDIALNADGVNSPQSFYFNQYLQSAGGTSISAPEIAGFYAQENAYLLYIQSLVGNTCGANLSSPCAPMGNANYYLYDEGLNQRAPHYPFYDVTSGCNNNDITQQYGLGFFCAGTSYDLVTGWGSANMFQLAWSINNYLAGDSAGPSVTFSGPLIHHWYHTDQSISWTISDTASNGHPPNGVAGYSFYWDSDPGDAYSEPAGNVFGSNSFYSGPLVANQTAGQLLLSWGGAGCHTIIVRAWDNSGQASAASYGPVCFDNFSPATFSTELGIGQYPYFVGPVEVVLTASDIGSGVASTSYQVDNGGWQTYNGPIDVAVPGSHVVSYYSTDIAGNIEPTESVNFTITSNNTFTLTVAPAGSSGGLISTGDGDIDCGSVCSHLYYNGTQVILTATPDQGSVFIGWTGCDFSSGNVCGVQIDDNRSVTAIFNVPTPLQLVSVTPCRVADTRLAKGPFGGPPINGNDYRDYVIPQSPCGIPSTAAAYSLNITVVPHGPLGYLTAWSSGLTRPVISTLNSYDGRTKANAAIVPAGNKAAISVFVTDTTDVILDIDGYFVPAPAPSALAFYPLAPCRVADTRNPQGDLGGPYLTGGVPRDFPLLEASSCHIPSTAQAYSLNLTAVPHAPLGFLTVWPTGQSQPGVSTLNSYPGQVVANAAIVPAGTGGKVSAFASNDTDLVIDIDGYFAAPGQGGLSLYQVAACRVLDTRSVGNRQPFSGEIQLDVLNSACAPPSQSKAYVMNATVVPAGPLGFLSLWPAGSNRPEVSTMNAADGAVTSNMAIVPAGTKGKIDIFASDPTQLVLDISSYFAP